MREFKKAEIDELNGVFVLTETELEEVSGGRFLPGLVNLWHTFIDFLATHDNTNDVTPPPPPHPDGYSVVRLGYY